MPGCIYDWCAITGIPRFGLMSVFSRSNCHLPSANQGEKSHSIVRSAGLWPSHVKWTTYPLKDKDDLALDILTAYTNYVQYTLRNAKYSIGRIY